MLNNVRNRLVTVGELKRSKLVGTIQIDKDAAFGDEPHFLLDGKVKIQVGQFHVPCVIVFASPRSQRFTWLPDSYLVHYNTWLGGNGAKRGTSVVRKGNG